MKTLPILLARVAFGAVVLEFLAGAPGRLEAAELASHYAAWIKEITPLQKEIHYISVGVDSEPRTMLCSANWSDAYADCWNNLLGKGTKNGYWDFRVERSGSYEIALYGWPKESGTAFGETFAGFTHVPGRPVASARLALGDRELTAKTSPREQCVVFTVPLEKGEQPRLQSWLHDAKGQDLGGAYFVYITRR